MRTGPQPCQAQSAMQPILGCFCNERNKTWREVWSVPWFAFKNSHVKRLEKDSCLGECFAFRSSFDRPVIRVVERHRTNGVVPCLASFLNGNAAPNERSWPDSCLPHQPRTGSLLKALSVKTPVLDKKCACCSGNVKAWSIEINDLRDRLSNSEEPRPFTLGDQAAVAIVFHQGAHRRFFQQ